MDDDLVKRLRRKDLSSMKTIHQLRARSAELEAENAALKQEKAVRGTNCVLGSAQCQQLKDAQEALTNAVERIAALESGQPVEVRGEMWQLMRAKPVGYVIQTDSGAIGNQIAPCDWSTFDTELDKVKTRWAGWLSAGRATIEPVYMLTASAQEANQEICK